MPATVLAAIRAGPGTAGRGTDRERARGKPAAPGAIPPGGAMDLTAIREALASQITGKTGLRAEGQARDSVSPPCAVVMPGNPLAVYGDTMDGAATINLAVMILVSDAPGAERSQSLLDAYLGIGAGEPGSVIEAIVADPSLGGTVQWCQPVTVSQYGRLTWGGVDYFGARLSVSVGSI